MKRLKKYFFPVLIVALVVIVISWLWVFRKADDSVKNMKVEYEVEASQIIQKFEADENLANKQFLGKVIIVSGVIESIKETDHDFSIYLKNNDDMSGVLCSFNKSSVDISKLEVGTIVKVKGMCTGYLIDVVLNKCIIVD